MKRFALFVLAIVCVAVTAVVTSSITVPTASAKTPSNSIIVDAASFRPVQTDALTGIAIDPIGLDGSKRPCTRLKMRINRMTREEIGELAFRLRGGVIDLRKQVVAHEGNGLIIEMTAYKNTVFYLQHPRFGMSNEVTISTEGNKEYYIEASLNQLYPITVQSNVPDVEVYIDGVLVGRTNAECVLSVADVLPGQHRLKMVYGSSVKEQTVEVHRNSTFFHQEVDAMGVLPQDVIFQVEPVTAVVTFDGEILSLDEGGAAFRTKRQGRYSYSVEAQDYHAESGQIVVAGDKVVKRITLRPAFGWLQVSSTTNLSGAKVYVDNRLVGTVPLSERVRLSSGTHALRIVKEKYKAYTSQVTITDNQTSTLTPSLAANFAVVSLTVADGAEIWINNERKGSGSWRGELALGTYRVETRKSGYRTSVESLDVATASPINRTLTAPSPIYGSLRIVSQPLMASVKVDGRAVGETPSTLSKVLVGKHTIEITKSGYAPYKKDITIAEGQTANLNAILTKAVATSTSTSSSGNARTSSGGGVPDFCEMVFVEGGTFTMGATSEQGSDAESDEKPAHRVTVSDFYIGKYEVTQAQWKAIMGTTVAQQRDKADPGWSLQGEGDNYPMYYVSWEEVQTFIQKLNQKTGRRYRLPTEAEWEYAARGGNKSQGYKYSGSNDIGSVAWYDGNSGSKTHPVGQKRPNELGIYDMSGNVWEWCQDWYSGDYYSSSSQTNPTGPSSGSARVLRGGGWNDDARYCRVSYRGGINPSDRSSNFGFRLVLGSSAKTTTTASTTTSRATSTNSTAQKSYKVGDYYKVGGKKGVVFEVTSDGRHGKIISLNGTRLNWEGAKSWCARFGSGWRLPTKEELQTIYRAQSTLNSTLAANGDELKNSWYWSSNGYVNNSSFAWGVGMNDGYTDYNVKRYSYYVRAVSAF